MFISLADLKAAKRIPSTYTDDDATLQVYVDAANAAMLAMFGLEAASPGTYRAVCYLDPTLDFDARDFEIAVAPLLSIEAVELEGDAVSTPADWVVTGKRTVRYIGGRFGSLVGHRARRFGARLPLAFTFRAGFESVPADLKIATLAWAVSMEGEAANAGIQTEQVGRYRYSRYDLDQAALTNFLPPLTATVLRQYMPSVILPHIAEKDVTFTYVPDPEPEVTP